MKKINQLQQMMFRSYYQDGLWDIWLGLNLIILGGGYSLIQQFQAQPAEMIVTFLYVGLIYGSFRGTAVILRWAKEKFTQPRSGYVRFKPRTRETSRKTIYLRVAVVILILMTINIVTSLLLDEWAGELFRWLVISLVFAGVFIWMAVRFELPRYYFLAILMGVGGLITGLLIPLDQQMMVFYFLLGTTLIVEGTVQLLHFVRTTQPVEEGEEEPDD